MSYGRITTETMTDIADAIREKTGSEEQVIPAQMPERIRSIQTGSPDAVLYVEQELTEEQKAQARSNIDAVGEDDIPIVPTDISAFNNDSGYQTAQDVQTAISGVRQLPTGGTTGDFLRKDAQGNAAWETVQAWQGGSY